MSKMTVLVMGAALGLAGVAMGEEHGAEVHGAGSKIAHVADRHEPAVDTFAHPTISEDGSWAGAMVIVILVGFFLTAAVIGPIVRANAPEEAPMAHGHDDAHSHGAAPDHGHGGSHGADAHH